MPNAKDSTPAAAVAALAPNKDDGMEDPAATFDTATPAAAAFTVKAIKKKKELRFSLDSTAADELGDAGSHVQRIVRDINRSGKVSMDMNELASVSTAAPSIVSTPGKENVDESLTEQQKNPKDSVEDEEVALAQETHSATSDDFPPLPDDEDDNNNDDGMGDDLIPPPPPESPEMDDHDDEVPTQGPDDAPPSFPESAHKDEVPPGGDLSQADDFLVGGDDPAPPDDDFPVADDVNEDDEDDKEGQGFDMNTSNDDKDGVDGEDDPSTPASVVEHRRRKQERKQKLLEKKEREASKRRKTLNKSVEEDSDDETPVPEKKKKKGKKKFNPFATTFSPKGIPLPVENDPVPISNFKDGSPHDKTLRRSKRARMAPLEFWRGEKYVYGANDFGDEYDGVRNMPVVKKVELAPPTPYKKRKAPPALTKKKSGKKGAASVTATVVAEKPWDSTKLRSKYDINTKKSAVLWDERYQENKSIKVLAYSKNLDFRDLPRDPKRKKSEGKVVGQAAQSFNMRNTENPSYPGYIVGSLKLPPKAIKDAESVSLCAQVFTVVKGQQESIEVAYGDPENEGAPWDPDTAERFLLSVGDNFLVPPGNTYRLQNHSKTTEAFLSWTIIRHHQSASGAE